MTWIKVKHPDTNEIRSFMNDVFDERVYQNIHGYTKVLFKLDNDYQFYFHLIDEHGDKVAIKQSYEFLDYIKKLNYSCLRLEIVPQNNFSETMQPISYQPVDQNTMDSVVKTAAATAAQVYRSLLSPPTTTSQPDVFICNGCWTPIQSSRHRCETCADFDLCSLCKCRINHNPSHNFQIIHDILKHNAPTLKPNALDYQYESKSTASGGSSSQPVYICDNCDSDIVGIRHSCDMCPDFDLCHSCFAIIKQNHPEQHTFSTHLAAAQLEVLNSLNKKTKNKSCDDTIPNTIQHFGVECDHCLSPIQGIRYKCGHCSNFDLCEKCEQVAPEIHEKTHAFIKIRYPIHSLAKMPILPKFNFLGNSHVLSSNSETVESSQNSKQSDSLHQEPILDAAFIADLNVPDRTILPPKKKFFKMWKIKNTGDVVWPIGTYLISTGDSMLTSCQDQYAVPIIFPNREASIAAELQTPEIPGQYTCNFCLCTPDGTRFGDDLWCTIEVDHESDIDSASTSTRSHSINSSTMIFPTPLNSSDNHYDEYDNYSETTGEISNTTFTYTDSQISSLSPDDEESLNGAYDSTGFADEELADNDGSSINSDPFADIHDMQSIPLNNVDDNNHVDENDESQTVSLVDSIQHEDIENNENSDDEEDDDDGFCIVNKDSSEDGDNDSSPISSSANSIHTVTPQISRTTSSLSQSMHTQYQSQLTQLHEMGFTTYDSLAITLLNLYDGQLDKVICKLLEYP